MKDSVKYLNHCLDVIEADKNISENTMIVMFVEYAKRCKQDANLTEWVVYSRDYKDVDNRPKEYGRYEVYRKGCDKQHYETWNNTGWAYNNNDITHWREIKPPPTE